MTGLRVPVDLDDWQQWRARRTPVRSLKRRLGPGNRASVLAWTNSPEPPRVAVGVAATTASGRAALVAPLAFMGETPCIVQAEHAIDHLLPGWVRTPTPAALPASVQVVLADGHYLELGHDLWRGAQERGIPYLAVQHGLITPLAPPLAPGAILLAWSEQDGLYWRAGRHDVSFEVVGSELLWQAGAHTTAQGGDTGPLTYLGQGHAAELWRSRLAHAAMSTCREHGAVYRPHPSERDAVSRAVLAAYTRAGITIDTAGVPLVELDAPVVSVFSTGVLEAAAQGRNAWVDFPRPPAWLAAFWERYGMRRLGGPPTAAPARGALKPARRVAEIVAAHAT
ncbi:hypothetical protein ASG76_00860 [Nocardioides sp. Soil774]|uniref:hypothetical protein n=1 Tax=Nocardioides sp. Soil774 TaxID=1736408 RepID=UPI0006FF9058|nr:hypothetical protein [Nocardioides sp. Soil774]KRE97312.1 hypothetical protein ASG76_00860 [Nocardioides sp. Soil774]